MGLSAHLAGVQNAFVLILFGLSLALATVWGTSSATPGAGYSGSMYQEMVVNTLLYSGSFTIIIASIQTIIGLVKNGRLPSLTRRQ